MKHIGTMFMAGALALSATSCSDFLDTEPKDALSPSNTWLTQDDAEKFLIGCYDYWEDPSLLLYWDAGSDFAYANFPWEGLTNIGNGSLSAGSPGWSLYDFSKIRQVNTLLENIDKCGIADEAAKTAIVAQARFIRAYQYFKMNWNYGGVALIGNFASAEEARVPRNTEAEVREYVEKELDEIIPLLPVAAEKGRITRGAALALRMRGALYYGDWAKAKECAQQIIGLGEYSLDDSFANVFNVKGQDSPEIILAIQSLENTYSLYTIGQLYNNGEGGWSSVVPTQHVVNNFEMANGMAIDEPGSGYDATHPFANRDPRLAMTVLYPGCDYTTSEGIKAVFNTLDKEIKGEPNPNFYTKADNSSKTGLTWYKYQEPITQYADMWATTCNVIVFRYAEVLLSLAEASNELSGPSAEVYEALDQVRQRVGMPKVDQGKYGTKEKLRELIRRERGAELAGEGLRRADILRWKTDDGKMVAEQVLNETLERMIGTVDMAGENPETRATIDTDPGKAAERKVEDRVFKAHNRYLPIPTDALDANKGVLNQNDGY